MNLITFSLCVSVVVLSYYPSSVHSAADKVVCYYTQWSIYRQAEGMFSSAELDPKLCTHYLYGFAGIDGDGTSNTCNGCIKSVDPNLDLSRSGFKNFTSRKQDNPSAKFMLSLGGWKEGSERFSKLSREERSRKEFAKNLIQDLEKYGFDGVDFCWQYPTFRLGSIPEDRENYVLLVKEVRESFEKHAEKNKSPRMQISLVVPSLKSFIPGFDLKNLGKYVDFMNVVNYDYHLSDEPAAYHHSPLYPIKEDVGNEGLTADATMQNYIKLGADPTKLILGIPTYGRSFTLEDENENGFGAPTLGQGPKGPITGSDGFLAYYEICAKKRDEPGWIEVRSNATAVGPYMYNENVWVGFDNEDMVARKARYAKSQNLGGIMFWTLDMDDFRASCSDTKNPLIKAGRRGLGLDAPIPPTTPVKRVMEKKRVSSGDVSTLSALHGEKKVVCYHTNWSVYRSNSGKFTTDQINPFICSHYLYAFAGLTMDGIKSFDPHADFTLNGIKNFTSLKNLNPSAKFLLSVGGWKEGSERFSLISGDPGRRANFTQNAVRQIMEWGFDGIDLVWQYPTLRLGGVPEDKMNYVLLTKALREELDRVAAENGREKMVLSLVVPSIQEYTKGYDFEELSKYVDFMNVVTYDIHLSDEPAVFHHSPLRPIPYELENELNEGLNVDAIIRNYLVLGADPSKVVMGIPCYGRSMLLEDPEMNEFGSAALGKGPKGPFTGDPGTLSYYEICTEKKEDGWKLERPYPNDVGPYMYKENVWVSFDDEAMVKRKAEYALSMNLGGIMFWALDSDDFRGLCSPLTNPLIKAGRRGLGLPLQTIPPPPPPPNKMTTLPPRPAQTISPEPVTEPQPPPTLPPPPPPDPPRPASRRVPTQSRPVQLPSVPRPTQPIEVATEPALVSYATESPPPPSRPNPVRPPNQIVVLPQPPRLPPLPSLPSFPSFPTPDSTRSEDQLPSFSSSSDGHRPIVINNPQNVYFQNICSWVYNVYHSKHPEATENNSSSRK